MLLTWFLVIAGLAALGFLGMGLSQKLGAGRIQSLNEKRRATSRIVSRGEYVDGNRHIEVALALTQSTLLYENGVVQGALDLRWVREIEYDSALATGVEVDGRKVLRLRTDSQSFEFVLPNDEAPRWHLMLPPRLTMEPIAPAAPLTALATQGAGPK